MKKVLSTVVCAAMGLSMFAAPVTLKVYDYQDATSPNSFDDNKLVWERFEKDHPNIKIERETSFNDPFHQKMEAFAAAGQMPDVFYMWPGGKSTNIHTNNLAKDLKPFMEKDGILDDYMPLTVDPTQQAGGYIAEIPFGLTSTNCVFVNTKVLKEAGIKEPAKTYEELVKQCEKLAKKGKKGIIMANQDTWVMQSCLFSMVLGRYAGADWAKDVKAGKINFSEPWFKDAVQMIKTMYDDGVLSQETLGTNYGEVPGQFASEMGAYLIDGDWRCGAFLTDASTGKALIDPAKQASDIELVQFPALPGEVLHGSNSGTLGVGYGMSAAIPAGSEKEAAAWELIKWLSGPEVQQRRLDTGASFPSLVTGLSYDNQEPLGKKRADWYGTANGVTPVFDSEIVSSVAEVLNTKLQELGLGACSVTDVCREVQAAFEDAYPEVKFVNEPNFEAPKAEKKWWQFWK